MWGLFLKEELIQRIFPESWGAGYVGLVFHTISLGLHKTRYQYLESADHIEMTVLYLPWSQLILLKPATLSGFAMCE